MPTLPSRLASALAPDYEIHHEIDRGGMGIVFLARDPVLRRDVAIKVLRPELATARATERFLREARTLAALRHPGIIAVHTAGEADGLPYYVMDYLPGATLAERLTHGALDGRAVTTLGVALLEALEAAHRAGIVHRDIKPSNILLVDGRAVLGDFGLAKSDPDTSAETAVAAAGTPGYMPPEQAAGGAVTPRTDLYAVGIVLYEAMTGRRWIPREDAAASDWTGVPRRFARVLLRALAWSPDQRWPDAAAFRRALASSGRTFSPVRIGLAGATVLGVSGLLVIAVLSAARRDAASLYDLAVVPLDAVGLPATLGTDIAILTRHYLETIPQLRLTPERIILGWHDRQDGSADPVVRARALRARFVAGGSVARSRDGIEIRVSIVDSVGPSETTLLLQGEETDLAGIADAIALGLVGALYPQLRQTYRGPVHLSDDFQAVREFLNGEAAFYGGAWFAAQRHYTAAIGHDSLFSLARWRLINAYRWTPGRTPDLLPHLEKLRLAGPTQLRPLDVMLVEAQLERAAGERVRRYEEAMLAYPQDEYAVLLFGEELLHRGPLAGIPFDSSLSALVTASEMDAYLTPAFELLAWFHIRQGNREPAARALARLREITQPLPPDEVSHAGMLAYAFAERFDPATAPAQRAALFELPDRSAAERLAFALRAGLAFSLPATQLELGRYAAARRVFDLRWSGHYAQALALIVLGRPASGFRQLDSAAIVLRSGEASLHAAQWRVIPNALGIDLASAEERQQGMAVLERLAAVPGVAAQARWSLALDAITRGDTLAVRRWYDGIPAGADPLPAEHGSLLQAYQLAAAGNPRAALEHSGPLLVTDVRHTPDDAFARTVLHVLRGDWFEQTGDARGAERSRLFYENLDIVGWLGGLPQAAEIEWALSPWLDLARARAALDSDPGLACALARRVLLSWTDPEARLLPLRQEAAAMIGRTRAAGSTPTACRP